MIRVTSIRHINDEPSDEVWIIVRSLKHQVKNAKQIKVLSPSSELFGKYLHLKKDGEWSPKSFKEIYAPDFLAQMRAQDAREALNYLYKQDKAGKTICLACFCPDEHLCHRSIVAGLLQGCGCNVKNDSGESFEEYYFLFKNQ